MFYRFLIVVLILVGISANAEAQNYILNKEQQRLAQANPCLALATIENDYELRAYGEGRGWSQSDAYAEARIMAETQLLQKINDYNAQRNSATKKGKKGRKANKSAKKLLKQARQITQVTYVSGMLCGTRPILVKYQVVESMVECRVCLSMPIVNIETTTQCVDAKHKQRSKRVKE